MSLGVEEGVDVDGDRPTFDAGVHAATTIAMATITSHPRAWSIDGLCVTWRLLPLSEDVRRRFLLRDQAVVRASVNVRPRASSSSRVPCFALVGVSSPSRYASWAMATSV
jgi:hypothetical protein